MFLPAWYKITIDPLGRPTDPALSDHRFLSVRPYVRKAVPTFQTIAKQNKHRVVKIMITNVGTVGLTEGIIDNTYLVFSIINYVI